MKMTKMEVLERVKELYDLPSLADAETYLLRQVYDNISEHLRELYDEIECEEIQEAISKEQIKNMAIAIINELWAE